MAGIGCCPDAELTVFRVRWREQKELASELAVDDVPAYMLFDGTTRKAKSHPSLRLDLPASGFATHCRARV